MRIPSLSTVLLPLHHGGPLGQSPFAEQEKVALQHPLPLDQLPSLLAPHQATLHAHQALLEPLAIPGPLTHQELPNRPSWCPVRRKSPSYVLLRNLPLLPSSSGLLTNHCQT
ncbi:microtubule associated protein 2 [Rhinolophus ferrumequinum]|uniref:Microtubule associated protein 2 n=1 Tax=Rhinolophus ferrumequinum TaxID=59479 RepID=A0A7J7YJE3_RHIFE|nr:microtubule associated protein 2 [Rhinolophus ferrumequinum]